mgnify:FL=1
MYQIMFYGGLVCTFVFLIASVILFIKNDVRKKIGDLTGANARKEIKKLNEEMQSNQERMEALSDHNNKINFQIMEDAPETEKPQKKKRFSAKKTVSKQDEATDLLLQDEKTDLLAEDEVTSRLSADKATDVLNRDEAADVLSEERVTDVLVQEALSPYEEDATDVLMQESTDILYGEDATDVLMQESTDILYGEDATDVLMQESTDVLYGEDATDVLTDEATAVLTETLVSNAETELLYEEIKISEGAFDSILNGATDPDAVTEEASTQNNVFEIEEDVTVVHTDDSI